MMLWWTLLLVLPRKDFLFTAISAVTSPILSTSIKSTTIGAPLSDDNLSGNKDSVPMLHPMHHHVVLRSVEEAANSRQLGPIVRYPDPILRRHASPVTEFGPNSAVEVVSNLLIDGMISNATTAVQYGIDARIIVLKGDASPLPAGAPLVLANPNILFRSPEDKMAPWIEYCGVFMDGQQESSILQVELLRDEVVEVAAQNLLGIPVRKALRGEASRAFQHEFDHLDGTLIIDHAALANLPPSITQQEAPYHKDRQRRAYERRIYQGNEPLYR